MRVETIMKIASRYDWMVDVSLKDEAWSLRFSRKTLSGVPFSFLVEPETGSLQAVYREILSLVDALDPERYAMEWTVKSGSTGPADYRRAVADLEDIRASAWLVAYDLGAASGVASRMPWS